MLMTYEELKTFCNSLTTEQLQQEVFLSIVDSHCEKIISCLVSEEDEYFDHGDGLGTLEIIKQENPEDWEDIISDATLVPKGTVYLINE
jgi:hypothetical protein